MSRSKKKPIFKEKGFMKETYWRTVRRISKYYLRQGKDIPNPKSIICDWDYSDYTIDVYHTFDKSEWDLFNGVRMSRK